MFIIVKKLVCSPSVSACVSLYLCVCACVRVCVCVCVCVCACVRVSAPLPDFNVFLTMNCFSWVICVTRISHQVYGFIHVRIWYPCVSSYHCPALCVSLSVCVCSWMPYCLHGWVTFTGRVRLSKTVHSFLPSTSSFKLGRRSCSLMVKLQESQQF